MLLFTFVSLVTAHVTKSTNYSLSLLPVVLSLSFSSYLSPFSLRAEEEVEVETQCALNIECGDAA